MRAAARVEVLERRACDDCVLLLWPVGLQTHGCLRDDGVVIDGGYGSSQAAPGTGLMCLV